MLSTTSPMTRRQALRHVSAGALLATGLWPGIARGENGGRFRLGVVNDLHYMSEECGVWLRRAVAKIKADQPEFCIVAGDLTDHGTEEEMEKVGEILKEIGVPTRLVIGNHDYTTLNERGPYEKAFPDR